MTDLKVFSSYEVALQCRPKEGATDASERNVIMWPQTIAAEPKNYAIGHKTAHNA